MSRLGQPRSDLIDLLTSPVGLMVARRIDEAHAWADASPEAVVGLRDVVARMAEFVRSLTRAQLEMCHAQFNRFFRSVPFSEAIPVAIEIEMKWPHHIETLPEANRRLDLIRKGGEYAVLFSEQRVEVILAKVTGAGEAS